MRMFRIFSRRLFANLATASAVLMPVTAVSQSPAMDVPLPDLKSMPTMNGIDPRLADQFWNKWHLVTVRYRKDNDEQRFIYANDVAWKALQSKGKVYPKDSMFGKIAFRTATDSAFPNSVEPKDYTRIQLMLKDPTRFASTNGWGYSIYVAHPSQQPEEETSVVAACHACHKIVPDRDFIFAKTPFTKDAPSSHSNEETFKSKFQLKDTKSLAPFSRHLIETLKLQASQVYYWSMPLFSGSLNESVNPIISAAMDANIPFLLIDEDRHYFLLARAAAPTSNCATRSVELVQNTPTPKATQQQKEKDLVPQSGAESVVRIGTFCNGQLTWNSSPPLPL